jgi:hypothetical protein
MTFFYDEQIILQEATCLWIALVLAESVV